MHEFFTLVKVHVKMSMRQSGQLLQGKKKKLSWNKAFSYLSILLVGLLFLSNGRQYGEMALLVGEGAPLYASLVLRFAHLLLAFVTLMSVPTSLFFGGQNQYYLSMPIRPERLLLVKFVTVFLSAYLTMAMILLPMVIGAMTKIFVWSHLAIWLGLFLLLPLLPVAMLTLLILLFLWVLPALRDEKTLMRISTVLSLVFALGLGVISGFSNSSMESGALALPQWIYTLFPILKLGPQAFSGVPGQAIRSLAIVFGASLLWLGLSYLLAKKVYYPILTSMTSTGKGKVVSKEEVTKQSQKTRSPFAAFFFREVKGIWRSPVYMMNAVAGPILLVVLALVGLVVAIVQGGLSWDLIQEAYGFLLEDKVLTMLVALGVGCFAGSMSMIGGLSATTISRDAYHLDFIKSIPLPVSGLLFAKILGCTVFPMIVIGPVLLFSLVLPFSIYFQPLLLLAALVVTASLNLFLGLIDLLSPRLDWMDENAALKTNKNVFFSVLLSYGIIGLLALIAVKVGEGPADKLPWLALLVLGTGLLGLVSALVLQKQGEKLMHKL